MTKSIFINISNHPSAGWSDEQRAAALNNANFDQLLVDIPFPNVSPEATSHDIYLLAKTVKSKAWSVADMHGVDKLNITCMVQGEQTLCWYLTLLLNDWGVRVVVATTERVSVDNQDGTKTSAFRFVRFRKCGLDTNQHGLSCYKLTHQSSGGGMYEDSERYSENK